ncbi:MAG: hypothetical protein IJ007_00530 [Oscillospiraceae bacterium]|nr:hypothetical protein [Oscillospiraceae bacterium]
MDVLKWITIIIGFGIAIFLVNKAYQLYMKLLGAESMFFSAKKKLIAIVIVGLFITGILWSILGLS